MVKVAFFLRFKSQLQRIRPELVPRLEGLAVHAIKEAGGKVTGDHSLICAVFDENALGFWLDILQFIETLTQTLDKASIDLQGYTVLAGKDIPETPNALCRFLAGGKGGVFLDTAVSAAMRPYITVEEQGKWATMAKQYGAGPLSRLSEIKIFVPASRMEFPALKPNGDLPDSGQQPGILVASRSFEGKRDKLYVRVAGFSNSGESEEFPPLFVRFGSGGLNALIDSWAEWIHPASSEEEMHTAWEFLFRERLRGTPSSFAVRTAGRFFPLLVKLYRGLAQAKGKIPVIILENIQNGEDDAMNIVIKSLRGYNDFLLLGTCTGEITDDDMVKWRPLFPQLTRINTGEVYQKLPEIPLDHFPRAVAVIRTQGNRHAAGPAPVAQGLSVPGGSHTGSAERQYPGDGPRQTARMGSATENKSLPAPAGNTGRIGRHAGHNRQPYRAIHSGGNIRRRQHRA